MAGGSGGMGRFRLGAKRISWPDWIRASAIKSKSETTGSVSDTDVVTNLAESVVEASGSVGNSISIAIGQGINGQAKANSPQPLISSVTLGESGESEANSTVPIISTVANGNSGVGKADSSNPTVETIHNATNGEAEASSIVPTSLTLHDVDIASGEGGSTIPVINTTVDTKESTANGYGSVGIVTWKAGLGGVVKDPNGNAVEGAEVHIIRDNDDVKVDSLITNQNGRWHSTLPGGKTTDADPEVYSIEVWYRDGKKRSSDATLYKASNRPFIDTADPSGSSPYK